MNINHFLVAGNLTRDPELRRLPGGRAMARYTVAVNQYASDGEQTWERCDFIPISSFGRQAENDGRYLRKGQAVLVECAVHSWSGVANSAADSDANSDAKHRGGFNFVAMRVHYLSPRQSGSATRPTERANIRRGTC